VAIVGASLDREGVKLRVAHMDQADEHGDLQSDEVSDLARLSHQDPNYLDARVEACDFLHRTLVHRRGG